MSEYVRTAACSRAILAVVDGLSAVTTTGIYCRPGCSARPRPENVRRFDVAAAAEASGYRACMHCRPYRSSPTFGWTTGPELVCRAVHMIIDGALDAQREDHLAPGVEHVADNCYRRIVVVHGDPGVLELTRVAADQLLLCAHLPHWEGLIHIVQRARRIFSLDASVDEASNHLSGDPVIGPLIAARPGLRVPGTWDPFETGVRAIIGQQVSVRGATTIVGRLVQRYGQPVGGLAVLGLAHTFPPPALWPRLTSAAWVCPPHGRQRSRGSRRQCEAEPSRLTAARRSRR